MSKNISSDLNNQLPIEELPNMVAAVNTDSITEMLSPKVFCRGDDIETFIKQCELYFEAKNITHVKQQERLVFCLLDDKLLEECIKTFKKGFQASLRMAFEKEKDVIEDFPNLINYRRENEEIQVYFKNVKNLIFVSIVSIDDLFEKRIKWIKNMLSK